MIRRVLALAFTLALVFAPLAQAELSFTSVSASSTSQTTTINAGTLVVINDSTSYSIYVRIFWEGETAAAATTAYTEIKKGEAFEFSRTLSIAAISIVCATSQTATVRLIYW